MKVIYLNDDETLHENISVIDADYVYAGNPFIMLASSSTCMWCKELTQGGKSSIWGKFKEHISKQESRLGKKPKQELLVVECSREAMFKMAEDKVLKNCVINAVLTNCVTGFPCVMYVLPIEEDKSSINVLPYDLETPIKLPALKTYYDECVNYKDEEDKE